MKSLPTPAAILPGLALCLAVAASGLALEHVEVLLIGARPLESLVFAILIGVALRSSIRLPASLDAGITFSAHFVLECAIVLLGASISMEAIGAAGPLLVAAIASVVLLSIAVSFTIGRFFGLSPKLAFLVAFGNSICGNSAIAASAPVVGADPEDVAASIAFTAVLGVAAVLLMPLLSIALNLSAVQYGVFAGLTVYAVPQVLAATAPIGIVSLQTGTLVKLIRVLMLGPLLLVVGLVRGASGQRISLRHMLPWFIVGFSIMVMLRSAGALGEPVLARISDLSAVCTTVAMAGLGLSVDIRSLRKSGGRVVMAAFASLMALCGISMTMILAVGIM